MQLLRTRRHARLPPPPPLLAALRRSSATRNLRLCRAAHALITTSGLTSALSLTNNLISTYSRCASLSDSDRLFHLSHKRDPVTWNALLSAYAFHGHTNDGLLLFRRMRRSSVQPTRLTFASVLNLCSSGPKPLLKSSEAIHYCILRSGFDSDSLVSGALVGSYVKLGQIDSARAVYVPMMSVFDASLMLGKFGLMGSKRGFLRTIHGFAIKTGSVSGIPVANCLINMYAKTGGLLLTVRTDPCPCHKWGPIEDIFIQTALFGAYVKKNRMDEAERLYNKLDGFDTVACNAMISAYVTNGDGEKALNLFSSLHKSGVMADESTLSTIFKACGAPISFETVKQVQAHAIKLSYDLNLRVASGILGSYIKCGDMDSGFTIFSCISNSDEITWTTMILGFVENGEDMHAFELYQQMRRSGLLPDEYAFTAILKACSCLAAIELGKQIHANAVKLNCSSDVVVGTSIIDMYAKCGSLKDLDRHFQRMSSRSIASWNAMVLGFAQHGYSEDALGLFEDEVLGDYNIEPEMEHYSCLVDVLGRAGLISEAETFIEAMPFNCSASMYRTLLSACRIQGNAEAGHRVAKKLIELEPSDSSAYVLLSNVYAFSNKWDEMADARETMNGKSVRKNPGLSWIE
ncbi:Pentatricopeptide repeat-containing protein [Acorus calamus]|uniref:Pentatricopeptide repeat-containing protein n=1 Tax=Acorus calamus TaxID=4465 RepID=A0AAV9E4J0_ACOCL|nr:Pentatricopeptide repeat-containing protein [Acorus calamus]